MTFRGHAHLRFRRWLNAQQATQTAIAEKLGYSCSYLTLLKTGQKRPGLRLAAAIERMTVSWPEGPIRAAEWVPLKSAATRSVPKAKAS